MERRDFLKLSIGAGALAWLQFSGFGCAPKEPVSTAIALPPLPYSKDALEPHISTNTLNVHYGKHHQGYVNKINALVKGTPYQGKSLAEIVLGAVDNPTKNALFNNAAQVFNHTFYWNSMKPLGGGQPQGIVGDLLEQSFGSYKKFCDLFTEAAASQFGSGWVWVVKGQTGLEIVTTSNAGTPVTDGKVPLITLDVWEHAYYLDYQNRRGDYVKSYLDYLANWDFAEQNLA